MLQLGSISTKLGTPAQIQAFLEADPGRIIAFDNDYSGTAGSYLCIKITSTI